MLMRATYASLLAGNLLLVSCHLVDIVTGGGTLFLLSWCMREMHLFQLASFAYLSHIAWAAFVTDSMHILPFVLMHEVDAFFRVFFFFLGGAGKMSILF